jgi:cyclic pyranopterin phosphate synthase
VDNHGAIADGRLVDRFGRPHTHVRVSVTDRCNLRCFYCMPAGGVVFRPHESILTFEEIARFVRVVAGMGIRKVRLTGGEPLVRKGVDSLVRMLARIPGIEDLALTTNGILLPEQAEGLKKAGLKRLNISLDTLDRERFRQISRRDGLDQVLAGIASALEVGFEQIKLNAIAVRNLSEPDIVPLAKFARARGLELRFIEFMPLGGDGTWEHGRVLGAAEILEILAGDFGPVEPIPARDGTAPATRYRFLHAGGPPVGIIASVTEPFCTSCGRLRLTSEGLVKNCLFSAEEHNAKAILRGGGSDEQLAALVVAAVRGKKKQHGTDDGAFAISPRAMNQIGG